MFAVSCFGCHSLVEKYESDNDDYSKIMVQALADRFVEAFAEFIHRQIRIELWGYARKEKLNTEDLHKAKYDGIRPAPGYPSQPDHTEKLKIWEAIKPRENAGIDLSESLSMIPASSISALVFAHPQSQYFAVGKIGQDQVKSYSERKRSDIVFMERWLSSILNYE
jgi:5-methyltetrahydrofolate--homocysteine methyltransferase